MSVLFDPGLQPERTELAWRRTALALGVGSLIAMRLLPAEFDNAWWAGVGVAGLLISATIWHLARLRYHDVNEALRDGGSRARLPGGGTLLALATLVSAIGVLGVAIVIVAAV